MGYVLTAYGIVLGTLGAYALHLERQRRALRRELSERSETNGG